MNLKESQQKLQPEHSFPESQSFQQPISAPLPFHSQDLRLVGVWFRRGGRPHGPKSMTQLKSLKLVLVK